MNCNNCHSDFDSYNWLKIIETQNIPLCDNCLLEILNVRIQYHNNQIEILKNKIKTIRG